MRLIRPLILAVVLVLGASTFPAAEGQAAPAFTEIEAAQHVGEEGTVTGQVAAISKSAKGTTFVNFGGRFPRQTFSGIVFSGDEAKVGDLKQYEGKVVAITGKIDLSSDQKPQIIIKDPSQIRLAEMAEVPTSAPPAATASMPRAPTPGAPAAPPAEIKKIEVGSNWSSPSQGGVMIRKDLALLFGAKGSASEVAEGDSTLELFGGVNFLETVASARKKLNLEGVTPYVGKVTTPGLPIGSFSAHVFPGIFAGGYNRLYLIADNADQIVSVLLVDEVPRQRSTDTLDTTGYHTYNFITARTKGSNDLVIKHEFAQGAPSGVVVVDSMLIDPTDELPKKSSSSRSTTRTSTSSRSRTGKVMERSRWFVPNPIVNLILRCVGDR